MRMAVFIAVFTGLCLVSAAGLWAGDLAGTIEGRVATPKFHLKSQGPVKNLRPNYINGYGYNPIQILRAYGISGSGAGQTIAIVEACGSPNIKSNPIKGNEGDLAAFSAYYKLPPATLSIYNSPGSGQSDTCQQDGVDWALETSLDVEWVHALAPRATIDLVIAPTESFVDLFAAVQYAVALTPQPQVVSMSWGGDEFSDEANFDSVFQNTGTVFIASSGDSGSGVQYPAASPNVVAAGGTSLYLRPNTGALKFPEVAWEGSGGGVSQIEAVPDYQVPFTIGATKRYVPDVALAADPDTGVWVYDSNYDASSGSNWYIIGGTSVAAPCWAAIVALADQLRAVPRARLTPLTDGHNALYGLAATAAEYKKYYRDITNGYNGDYEALVGYDLITGLGSPKANTLIPALGRVAQ